jgi:2-dehydro-3-deoxygluconokinase
LKKIVTFGQVMMRLSPPLFQRFSQATNFEITYAGGEANVGIAAAQWGVEAVHATCFPDNGIGEAASSYLRKYGLNTSAIVKGGDRLGVYYVENGANARASRVVYDRLNDSFCTLNPTDFDWKTILKDTDWFHFTGITPALSATAAAACLEAIKTARSMGVKISADVNYRKGLWKWGKTPQEIMPELTSYCDLIVCASDNAEDLYGIKDRKNESGAWSESCTEVMKMFPNVKTILNTVRKSISASHNTLQGKAFDGQEVTKTEKHDLHHIIDRIGSGDAFIAGYLYGIDTFKDTQLALDFATAAAALKHTIHGDFNLASVDEIRQVAQGDTSGRLKR